MQYTIHRIVIYPVDRVIHSLNNWGQINRKILCTLGLFLQCYGLLQFTTKQTQHKYKNLMCSWFACHVCLVVLVIKKKRASKPFSFESLQIVKHQFFQ